MIVTKKIYIDLLRPGNPTTVNVVQNDVNTRAVEIKLFEGGAPWPVPEGATVAVGYRKPDNKKGIYDKLPDGAPAVEINGSVVTVILAQQMLTTPGMVSACIVLNDAELNQLTSFPFSVMVAENPSVGAQQSEDYIRLKWMEDQLEQLLIDAAESGKFTGPQGDPGAPATLTSSVAEYMVSDSGTVIPSGSWTKTIPAVAQGKYLWTRVTQNYNTGSPVISYSVSRMGIDGSGSVSSVNQVSPDADGNVQLTPETIGALPDTFFVIGDTAPESGPALWFNTAPGAREEA